MIHNLHVCILKCSDIVSMCMIDFLLHGTSHELIVLQTVNFKPSNSFTSQETSFPLAMPVSISSLQHWRVDMHYWRQTIHKYCIILMGSFTFYLTIYGLKHLLKSKVLDRKVDLQCTITMPALAFL